MSHKPNFLQRIKGWAKLPGKKKNSMNDSDSSLKLMNAVIKKQELVPIFKKASPPPLKSILRNKTSSNIEDNKVINQKSTKYFKKDSGKRNIMGDIQYFKDESTRLSVSSDSNNSCKVNKDEINNQEPITINKNESVKRNLKEESNNVITSIVENIKNELSTNFSKKPSYQPSLVLSRTSLNELTDDSKKDIDIVLSKENTISMMNIFKKETSFIKFRKAAIKSFERLKRSNLTSWKKKKGNLRCFSDNTDVTTANSSEQKNSFTVIMINNVEKSPSVCCLDVNKILKGDKSLTKVDQVKKSEIISEATNICLNNSSTCIIKKNSKNESFSTITSPTTILSKPHKKKGKH